ncbi:MAG: leucine--tRNA ligase [Planctomycetales bacterium]|jgi:leucyl-tRNA synthetase
MPRYDFKRIEPKWQDYWKQNETFKVGSFEPGREKLYALDMFPYPSGSGLHVGHPEGYTATDIVCRYSRNRGKQVLHPMGWDAFGLPAEEYAIKTQTHPAVTTYKNIDEFRRQLQMLGFSYDWSREFATTDEDYYRWTQWIFLELFDTWYDSDCEWTGPDGKQRTGKGRPISELPIPENVQADGEEAVRRYQDAKRLAYQHEAPVNWCPALGTVLANEEIIDGKSERGSHPVERFPLRQWMLRITSYGDRLISELDDLNWSESIKDMQRNWIGRSTGAEVDFFVGWAPPTSQSDEAKNGGQCPPYKEWKSARLESGFPDEPGDEAIRVYTTRPDTLFGATYMVVAPEHPFVGRLTTPEQKDAVDTYVRQASLKSDLDRTELAKTKTGVFTGSYAINPVNGKETPIWVADYVLISYGTGAIMAVPGQDERDWEFAEVFDIPIIRTVQPPEDFDGKAYVGDGPAINSEFLNGLHIADAKAKIFEFLDGKGTGKTAINYRLRDWLFSRQRYWGEPFPIWHELDADGNQTGLMRVDSADELPVVLPEMEKFKPTGTPEPMLSTSPESWLYKTAEDGTKLKRETNTMPQWAGSCWYYLRFADPKNADRFLDPEVEKSWLPVDLYVGGAEHAVLHLLYARFWHKVLFDRGHVSTCEPFQKLVNQGMILGEAEHFGFQQDSQYSGDTVNSLTAASNAISKIGTVQRDNGDLDAESNTLRAAVKQACSKGTVKDKVILGATATRLCDQIRHDANERLPDDVDPVVWWNNERGINATMRLIARAITRTEQNREIWVSARNVTSADDSPSGYKTRDGVFVIKKPVEMVRIELIQGKPVLEDKPWINLDSQAQKMSKSRGNVINPDDVVDVYGADSLRLYEMFMGPLEQVKPWSMKGVEGVYRFLARVWRMITDEEADEIRLHPAVQEADLNEGQERLLHKTIKAVTEDIEKFSFNTAISRMMEFTNEMSPQDVRPKSAMETLTILLSPFAPHMAEELWQLLGHEDTLTFEPWPTFDESKIAEAEVEVPVQVNGKVRAKVKVPAGADNATIEEAAKQNPTVASNLEGKTIVKVIVVPGRLVNFVVKG